MVFTPVPFASWAKSAARQIVRRTLLSGTVMLGVQLALGPMTPLGVGSPNRDEVTGGIPLAIESPASGANAASPATALSGGREARLPVPARQAVLQLVMASAGERVRQAPEPKAVSASKPAGADAVPFDTCLPDCESRDPLLLQAVMAPSRVDPPSRPPGTVDARTPWTVPAHAGPVGLMPPTHPSSLVRSALDRSAAAGAATASVLGRMARWVSPLRDL